MAAGATFEPIATASLSSGTSYTFSSIPSTYTDLVLVCSLLTNSTCTIRMRFNGSGSNYYTKYMDTSPSNNQSNSEGQIYLVDNNGTAITNAYVDILNYSASTLPGKTVLYRSADQSISRVGGATWQDTSVISSIEINTGGVRTFATPSRLTLYGITRA